MYQVLSFIDYMMTRDVKLKNTKTGTIDTCFDDSDVSSGNCFGFMELEGIYDCKIELFGDEAEEGTESDCGKLVCCKVIRRNVPVGIMNMVQVLVGGDVYYVDQCEIKNIMDKDIYWYRYTRKDIIQVNDKVKKCFLPKHRS